MASNLIMFVVAVLMGCVFSRFTAHAVECNVGMKITLKVGTPNVTEHESTLAPTNCSANESCTTFQISGTYVNNTLLANFTIVSGQCKATDHCSNLRSCPHTPYNVFEDRNVTSCSLQCCSIDGCANETTLNIKAPNTTQGNLTTTAAPTNTSTTQPVTNDTITSAATTIAGDSGANATDGDMVNVTDTTPMSTIAGTTASSTATTNQASESTGTTAGANNAGSTSATGDANASLTTVPAAADQETTSGSVKVAGNECGLLIVMYMTSWALVHWRG